MSRFLVFMGTVCCLANCRGCGWWPWLLWLLMVVEATAVNHRSINAGCHGCGWCWLSWLPVAVAMMDVGCQLAGYASWHSCSRWLLLLPVNIAVVAAGHHGCWLQWLHQMLAVMVLVDAGFHGCCRCRFLGLPVAMAVLGTGYTSCCNCWLLIFIDSRDAMFAGTNMCWLLLIFLMVAVMFGHEIRVFDL